MDWSQQGVWHRFTVKLEGGRGNERIRIQVNVDDRQDRMLGISSFRRQSGTGCVTWLKANAFKRHNDTVYIASCGYGASSIFLSHWTDQASTDERGNAVWGWALLEFYEIEATAPPEDNEFNIELVFVEGAFFDRRQRLVIELAVQRWEQVIVGDLENRVYSSERPLTHDGGWSGISYHITDEVDDVRVFVGSVNNAELAWGTGGAMHYRRGTYFPITGAVVINEYYINKIERENSLYSLVLHELGHVLGFGSLWDNNADFLKEPSQEISGADTYFSGPRAIQTFNRLGGWNYQGNKVPVENDPDTGTSRDGHWRESVFGAELMSTYTDGNREPFSEITIAAFEDMGYVVDYSQADRYRLPRSAAKPTTEDLPHGWCEVIQSQPMTVED